MKLATVHRLALAWLGFVVIAVTTTSSCSVRHATGDYECTTQADCSGGRVCTEGWCVVTGHQIDAPSGMKKDAPTVNPDMKLCPPQCTSCNLDQKECKIDCGATNCTGGGAIVCPPGFNCDVLCSTTNSCRNGVNCAGTLSCDVSCSGASACRNVACGAGPCNVDCSGSSSCRGIQCGTSCACDVTCSPIAQCGEVFCTSVQCDSITGGCSSQNTGCETCP